MSMVRIVNEVYSEPYVTGDMSAQNNKLEDATDKG
jgi:hypothetical protein